MVVLLVRDPMRLSPSCSSGSRSCCRISGQLCACAGGDVHLTTSRHRCCGAGGTDEYDYAIRPLAWCAHRGYRSAATVVRDGLRAHPVRTRTVRRPLLPCQSLDAAQQMAFARRFGSLEINVAAGQFTVPGHPEVMVLSNIVENGRALGLADAGQDWGAPTCPTRNRSLSECARRRRSAGAGWPPARRHRILDMRRATGTTCRLIRKQRIEGRTATDDFNKLLAETPTRARTQRGPSTPEQRAQSGQGVAPDRAGAPDLGDAGRSYCNVGYVTGVDGMTKPRAIRY